MEKITIVKSFVKKVKRFRLAGNSLVFKINPIPENENPVVWIQAALHHAINKVTEEVNPNDKIGFTFSSNNFERGEGWLNFKDASDVTIDDIWGVIEKIFQSNSQGLNTDTFTLTATIVKMPVGKGRRDKLAYNTFDEECRGRTGIVTINNKDNLCLPRALVVGIAHASKDSEYKKVRDNIKFQTLRTEKLCNDASVIIKEEGAGISELEKFQTFLKGFKITVYDNSSKSAIFKGPNAPLEINLIYHNGHYNLITSLTSAFVCRYFCKECQVCFNNKGGHRCGSTCPACQKSPTCILETKIQCHKCNRYFRNQQCFKNHVGGVCESVRRCETCLKTVKSNAVHTCGEIFCKICRKHCPQDHLCYMQSVNPRHAKETLFIFYDLESRQDTALDDKSVLHTPNLCVFRQVCSTCITESKFLYCCKHCGICLQNLTGNEIIERFMNYILNIRKKFKKVVVIAHSGANYDHQFLLNYILTKTSHTPNLIMRGTKIISMETANVKFIDSLNYFPMALSKLPKAFGLGDHFKKGYFPHLFNTLENQNYVGPTPDMKFYSPDTMKADDREKFLNWHEQHKNDVFDIRKEIVEYCISDVEILTAACVKFRAQMIETGNVCPFTEACTIASCCNKVFRRNFLKTDTIGIIPKGGYRFRDNQSKLALQWLIWEEKQRETSIIHAAKQKEMVLHGMKVDGFYDNKVLEFHGCYFHGCPNCFKYDRDKLLPDGETMNTRYESTVSPRYLELY